MPPPTKGYSQEQAKEVALLVIARGGTVAEACSEAGRSRKWFENIRATDKDYGVRVDEARARRAAAVTAGRDPELYELGFAQWRKRFLGRDTYPHQQMWIDVLEGRDPTVFHQAITFRLGDPDRIIINTPPGHAKSTTITSDFVTYKLCMNPAFRVIIISKTAEAASKFLYTIKQYLTDPAFIELQMAYAPADGWKPTRGQGRWGSNLIYLAGRSETAVDAAAKDPSVACYGIGSQIYGSRTDLTILDDAVDDTNAHSFEKQFDWLTRTVLSRGRSAKVLVVGTRIAPQDLYSHLLNDDVYTNGRSPWTYMAQPAVLEFHEKPEDWVTLWPRSSQPYDEAGNDEPDDDGLYPAFDGPTLARIRAQNRPGVWALVYMQQQVSDEMTFTPLCVWGSVDRRRKPGPLTAGGWGHPYNGLEGMRSILGIDPAGTGQAFLMALAVDPAKRDRWVMNAWMGDHTRPSWYLERIKEIVPVYGIKEIVIESNAYASWLIHDEAIVAYCRDAGVKILPHRTGNNKSDPDFGVASMSSLFGTSRRKDDGHGNPTGGEMHAGDNVIHIPDPDFSPGVKAFIDQLLVWVPGKSGGRLRQDGVMAAWFCELRARIYINGGDRKQQHHVPNKYLSPRARRRQMVIPAGLNLAA